MKTLKYAVYPGYMVSRVDKDVHYITAEMLMRLYGVDPAECLVVHPIADTPQSRLDAAAIDQRVLELKLIPLHPNYWGKYTLPSVTSQR